jgi:ferritin-like metal-binding protein YciE
MAKHKTFETLFLNELKDLYDAEHQLVKALPKLAAAATDPELKAAIQKHLRETETHVARAERAFALLGEEADRKNCAGDDGCSLAS